MKKIVQNKVSEELTLEDAVKAITSSEKRKFVETIDMQFILNLKENQKKDTLKGSFTLPNKFGAEKKIIVFCEEKDAKGALAAGAIKAGLETLEKEINDGFADFDVVIAKPSVMAKIAKLGKVLGPKGLMPNPKDGTVAEDVEKAIGNFLGGKSNFKMDPKQAVIKASVAKIDMDEAKIVENALAFTKSVVGETKKFGSNAIKKIIVKSTMGPSIKVNVSDIIGKI